jgi:hypothetical protein
MTTLPPHNHAACPERSGADAQLYALAQSGFADALAAALFWALKA